MSPHRIHTYGSSKRMRVFVDENEVITRVTLTLNRINSQALVL